jgi:hypothetical protein
VGLVLHELGFKSNRRLIIQGAVPTALVVPTLQADKELLLRRFPVGRNGF